MDQPQQQFFAFNAQPVTMPQVMRIPRIISEGLEAVLAVSGFTSEMKLELFTLGRNSIMMRVENIGDIFNTQGEVSFQTIDIIKLSTELFDLVNGFTISSD